jgi:hypothetical protein
MPAKLLEFHDPRKKPAPAKVTPVDLGGVRVSIGRQTFTLRLRATIESREVDRSSPDFQRSPETMEDTTSTVAKVGAQLPDVTPRAGKTGKKASRSGKSATSGPPAQG